MSEFGFKIDDFADYPRKEDLTRMAENASNALFHALADQALSQRVSEVKVTPQSDGSFIVSAQAWPKEVF